MLVLMGAVTLLLLALAGGAALAGALGAALVDPALLALVLFAFLLAGLVLGSGLDLVKGNGAKVLIIAAYTPVALVFFAAAAQVDLAVGVEITGQIVLPVTVILPALYSPLPRLSCMRLSVKTTTLSSLKMPPPLPAQTFSRTVLRTSVRPTCPWTQMPAPSPPATLPLTVLSSISKVP